MELLLPGRFDEPTTAYGYQRAVFDSVASGARGPTVSITPSTRHVGVTRRDTFRPGFSDAVRAANAEGYPVLVRGAGGGATAAGAGTFGFSVIRPSGDPDLRDSIEDRYVEIADFVLKALQRLGVCAEVGEVRDEFCPGDHSIRLGDRDSGAKIVGIAQRITRRATSVGGIVLVHGERDLARVLDLVYSAMTLPFRPGSVGSLRRAGYRADVDEAVQAFADEARDRYAAVPTTLDARTTEIAHRNGSEHLVRL